jgi:hypothetical protein
MTKWYNKVLIYDVEANDQTISYEGYVCTDNPHLFTGTHYDFAENSMRETLHYDTITNLLLENCVDENGNPICIDWDIEDVCWKAEAELVKDEQVPVAAKHNCKLVTTKTFENEFGWLVVSNFEKGEQAQ